MGFDLNSPVDFARATMGPVSSLLGLAGQLAGIDPSKWDIVEATFISNATLKKAPNAPPIKFLVFESKTTYSAGLSSVSDIGGRRKAKFQFPYRDGQTTDDLGALPQSFDLHCMWHGPNYSDALDSFLVEADQPSPGVLRHPVRGEQAVVMETWEITHSSESSQAALVRVRFVEHNFSIDYEFDTEKDSSAVKTALVAALGAITKINNVINKVESNIFAARQIAQQIAAVANLNTYISAFTSMLSFLNVTFNTGSSSDLPTLLPVVDGGVAPNPGQSAASQATGSNTFPVVRAPNDPFIGMPATTPSAVIAVLATVQAIDGVNAVRAQADALVTFLENLTDVATPGGLGTVAGGSGANSEITNDSSGALVFHDEILDLLSTAVLLQQVLEAGIASSQVTVQEYTTPRLMSVREVAFDVGLPVDDSYQIELLNPQLLSCNFIDIGTVLQVPVPV